jgi:hypothetical protein
MPPDSCFISCSAVLQHIAKAFHVSAAASSPPSTPRSLAQAGEAASRFANVPWTDADAGPHKQQQKQQAGGEGGKVPCVHRSTSQIFSHNSAA